jgi:hypothetical protein
MDPTADKSQSKRRALGYLALVVPLFAILAASIWLAARTWTATADTTIPGFGYFYMALGAVFSLVVGCGLMALVFYSSRYGYDEQSYGEPPASQDHTAVQDRTDNQGG